MQVNIQAIHGVCSEFVDNKGKRREVSIVISPLKVATNEDESKLSVITGCNMWKSCCNEGCYYSMVSRQKKSK